MGMEWRRDRLMGRRDGVHARTLIWLRVLRNYSLQLVQGEKTMKQEGAQERNWKTRRAPRSSVEKKTREHVRSRARVLRALGARVCLSKKRDDRNNRKHRAQVKKGEVRKYFNQQQNKKWSIIYWSPSSLRKQALLDLYYRKDRLFGRLYRPSRQKWTLKEGNSFRGQMYREKAWRIKIETWWREHTQPPQALTEDK